MKIGKFIFETYIGCTGLKIYSASIRNESGGSLGYADPSLLKVLWRLLTIVNSVLHRKRIK
jgi:hypothetical protein